MTLPGATLPDDLPRSEVTAAKVLKERVRKREIARQELLGLVIPTITYTGR